ncbi:hypothetical protein [Hyalangium gracile]|uniref:hypothetical protein n=1 Tax=Hyalangium gracile TaxID=394092 RepID=UPI001CCFAF7F|nr:hypothetical protein [Hyalangium gracile]
MNERFFIASASMSRKARTTTGGAVPPGQRWEDAAPLDRFAHSAVEEQQRWPSTQLDDLRGPS